jgi:hypothetical protein
MAVIAGNIVHQHRKIAQSGLSVGNGLLQGRNIPDIAALPPYRGALGTQGLCQGVTRAGGHIHKGHPCALVGKRTDHGSADTGAASRNKDVFALQAGVPCQARNC